MSVNLKEFARTPRGKLILALGALGCSWLFLLIYFSGDLGGFFPDSEKHGGVERELKELRQQNTTLNTRLKDAENLKLRYRRQLATYWQHERDGVVETELRNLVQKAALESELKLNTLGSVRNSRINNDLYYAEIDLSTSASVETVTRFLGRIEAIQPVLGWKRLDLRPEFPRGGNNQTAQTTQNLNINGTIRVIGFDGDSEALKGGKK